MEKDFFDELAKERERFIKEQTNSTADYEEIKKALEEKLSRDKVAIEKSFALQKLELEQTIEELRQVFTKGKDGLKGKLKEDFLRLLSEHKMQLDAENKTLKVELEKMREDSENDANEMKQLRDEIADLNNELQTQMETVEARCSREREILELEMREKLEEGERSVGRLQDRIALLIEENMELKERANSLEREARKGGSNVVSELKGTRQEVEELTLEVEKLREEKRRKLSELEGTVEKLRAEKERILGNGIENSVLLEERIEELETENARLKRHGEEQRDSSRKCNQLERKVQTLESENSEIRRNYIKVNTEQKREIERLRLQLEELQDSMNRRSDKVILAEKVLCNFARLKVVGVICQHF